MEIRSFENSQGEVKAWRRTWQLAGLGAEEQIRPAAASEDAACPVTHVWEGLELGPGIVVLGRRCLVCPQREQKGQPGLGSRGGKMIRNLIEEELVSVSTALWK